VDAYIPHGAAPEAWLAALASFLPAQQKPLWGEGEEIFGKYRLKNKVAKGGAADIYLAVQTEPEGFRRILAIKRLREEHGQDAAYTKMLLDEANLGAMLDHQNIVRVFDFGSVSGRCYIAMEYVDGGNLGSLIGKAKAHGLAFPEPIAAFIIAQVARALDYAHRRLDTEGHAMNLVHMDVSPQNILVNTEGTAKLIDFGIAKAGNPGQGGEGAAQRQGKLLYMSPEQALGAAIDHRSDLYSLGLVLFELLTSKRCFEADDELGLMDSIRSAAVPDIRQARPSTSRPMARLLDQSLQKDVSSRYGSASEMALDLSAYLDHLGLESLENDAAAFLRVLDASSAQAKTFVQSRFLPVRSDFVLPSEKARRRFMETQEEEARKRPPAWILPTASLLLMMIALLLWVSMNA
jgi:serine/threonine-protein kinase